MSFIEAALEHARYVGATEKNIVRVRVREGIGEFMLNDMISLNRSKDSAATNCILHLQRVLYPRIAGDVAINAETPVPWRS